MVSTSLLAGSPLQGRSPLWGAHHPGRMLRAGGRHQPAVHGGSIRRLLREQWIRAKYERQEFMHPDRQEPYSAGRPP